ncbi:ABC transporter permease [Phenylobacterium sp.]|uniref:ABC transporter permease n=1 Tax=Phenylobacterium sp. TaxID=1871053 RepID=UPI00121384A6|nr:ABC transporter permease [Phenylobacterium sp.]THD61347.1 MAG: FtsX-like permease family protein [Phenylobacterium sp.]
MIWASYARSLYRTMSRHRLYAAINVLGLALGVAVFVVLMLVVRFQTSFEAWIPHADQIYVIRSKDVLGNWYPNVFPGMLDELRGDYPQLVATHATGAEATVRRGGAVTPANVSMVDPSFFKVFDLPLAAGDKARLLQSPDDLVVTQSTARQYFGAANPIGQRLTLDLNKKLHDYRVVGVIKDRPPTTEMSADFLVRLEVPTPEADPNWREWGYNTTTTYLRFATPAQAKALSGDLDSFIDRHVGTSTHRQPRKNIALRLTPLLKMHLITPPAEAIVAATAAVAVLTLLLAAVNYVNLATARASMRAKEVALRKVMGATRPGLIAQFVGESVVVALCGALIGLAICELVLPLFSAAIGVTLKLDYLGDPWLAGLMAFVVLVVGVGAGAYPAFVLSRFQPASVLASTRSPGGGRAGSRLREALVVLQFAIAIGFTIGMAAIVSQAAYLHRADLGFQRQGLIEVDSFPHQALTPEQRASLLTAWRAEPGVVAAAQADGKPGDPGDRITHFKRPGAPGDGPIIHFASIGPSFLQTFGARLLAGRLPDPSRAADFSASSQDVFLVSPQEAANAVNIVLNAQAVQALGFRSPRDALGQVLTANGRRFMVIGVIRDMRFHSPREKIEPLIYWSFSGAIDFGEAAVRYAGVDTDDLMARMAVDWRRIVPTEPFEAKTVVAKLEHYYQTDNQVSRMLTLAAVLAVVIGCIGLYGLASFNTAQRVREIGIRKTLGATTAQIVTLLIGQFLRPVVLANLLAWPLAFLALRTYLAGFDQRIALSPAYFLAASAATILVAVATVSGQALLVARATPAKALRHE